MKYECCIVPEKSVPYILTYMPGIIPNTFQAIQKDDRITPISPLLSLVFLFSSIIVPPSF